MSWVRVWIHFVFATKNRAEYFESIEIRERMFYHIKTNAREKGLHIDSIGGYKEHIHCLVSISKDQTISKIVQLIKGESSFWINKQNFFNYKFYWQDDYWANSVSESQLQNVRSYIKNQEEHHSRMSFDDELQKLSRKVFSQCEDN